MQRKRRGAGRSRVTKPSSSASSRGAFTRERRQSKGRRSSDSADDAETFLTVYEAERHDEQNTAALIVAIVVGTLAYLAGATAFLSQASNRAHLPDWVLMGAPFPLLILSSYVTFHYSASRLRQSYLIYLESRMAHGTSWVRQVNCPGYVTLHQGLFSGWGWWQAPFTLLTIVSVLAHVAAVAGFTFYIAVTIALRAGVDAGLAWTFRGVYLLMLLLNVAAMVMVLVFAGTKHVAILVSLRRNAEAIAQRERERWAPVDTRDRKSSRRLVDRRRISHRE